MGSYSSDQLVAYATTDGQMVPTSQMARLTSIQAEAASGSKLIFKSGGTSGTVIATYEFGDEGLQMYLPGSGIRFDEGIYLDLTATASVTITFT
jgi:hypothetical protein